MVAVPTSTGSSSCSAATTESTYSHMSSPDSHHRQTFTNRRPGTAWINAMTDGARH
jgi:hypothetical protein